MKAAKSGKGAQWYQKKGPIALGIVAVGLLSWSLFPGRIETGPAEASVGESIANGELTLHEAAKAGNTKAISVFIDSGADLDAQDEDGETALHYAAYAGQSEAIRMLLGGADPSATDASGRTPLQIAQATEQNESAAILAKTGVVQ